LKEKNMPEQESNILADGASVGEHEKPSLLSTAILTKASPRPWRVYRTGGYIAILDAKGKTVIRITVKYYSLPRYQQLSHNFDFIVAVCNGK
jgi:hypothetical protein